MEKWTYENIQDRLSDKLLALLMSMPSYKDRYIVLKHCLKYVRSFKANRKKTRRLNREARNATCLLRKMPHKNKNTEGLHGSK